MEIGGLRWDRNDLPPGQLLLLSTLFFLPVVNPALFGWLNGFLAVPVFSIFVVHGYAAGFAALRFSLLLVGLVALLMHQLDVYLFSLTLVPLGFSLSASARHNKSIGASGVQGCGVLAVTWLIFWTGYGILTETNPYITFHKALDLGFQQALEISSSKEAGLTPDMVDSLHTITNQLRETIPRLLPGISAIAVILTVWINMALGNRLIAQHRMPPWGEYATWKLPDQLVWLPIVAIIALLAGKGVVQSCGGCLLLVSGVLYLLQGISVLFALLTDAMECSCLCAHHFIRNIVDAELQPIFFGDTGHKRCLVQYTTEINER